MQSAQESEGYKWYWTVAVLMGLQRQRQQRQQEQRQQEQEQRQRQRQPAAAAASGSGCSSGGLVLARTGYRSGVPERAMVVCSFSDGDEEPPTTPGQHLSPQLCGLDACRASMQSGWKATVGLSRHSDTPLGLFRSKPSVSSMPGSKGVQWQPFGSLLMLTAVGQRWLWVVGVNNCKGNC